LTSPIFTKENSLLRAGPCITHD